MRVILLILTLALGGCAWSEMDSGEKAGVIIGGAILLGAAIIKNSQDPDYFENDICISTRSLETGCPP
jgi:hypothetical protein